MLNSVYTDDLNHHRQVAGVGCYVGDAWVNSLSYADDMVLLTPTETALQKLVEVCHTYAGPYDIVYNIAKTSIYVTSTKALTGPYKYSRVRI